MMNCVNFGPILCNHVETYFDLVLSLCAFINKNLLSYKFFWAPYRHGLTNEVPTCTFCLQCG